MASSEALLDMSCVRFGLAATCLFVGACATLVYEGRYPYERGWRVATALTVGHEFASRAPIEDCREQMTPEDVRSTVFAVVRYNWGHGPRFRIVADTLDPRIVPNETLYVNIEDCRESVARPGEARAAAG